MWKFPHICQLPKNIYILPQFCMIYKNGMRPPSAPKKGAKTLFPSPHPHVSIPS